MNKHDKSRVFTAFQHWLGTHYTNFTTDSGNMTERARRYLKENPKALDLFAVVGQREQLKCQCTKTEKYYDPIGDIERCQKCEKAL